MKSGETRTAFVTGGTGFVGTNLVKRLTADGWEVTALHRPTSKLDYLRRFRVRLVSGDVTDPVSLERAVPEGVDTVFHVAADLSFTAAGEAQQYRNNVEGTRNLLDVARRRGARCFVHTSTLGTYGGRPETFDESATQLGATSPLHYSRSKWLAEEEVRRAARDGFNALILNPGGILGPYDVRTWGAFFFLVRDGLLPYAPDQGQMVWCHVDDVVDAQVQASTRGRRGENYILGGAVAPLDEVLAEMAALQGLPNRVRRLPTALLMDLARAQAAIADHTGEPAIYTPDIVEVFADHYACRFEKAERELGYRAHTLREMLVDCHRWLCDEGLLAR